MKPKSPPKVKSSGSDTDVNEKPTSDEQPPIKGKVLCKKLHKELTRGTKIGHSGVVCRDSISYHG